jgi:hypothetical protein
VVASDDELERLHHVLEQLGWQPQEGRTPGSYFIDFGDPHIPLTSAIAALTEHGFFMFYAIFGVSAANDVRDEVARFITRANYGLSGGCFEMDYDDGQLQVRSGLDCTGIDLSEKLMVNVIVPAMAAAEQYGGALMDVLAGKKSAVEAVEEAESE